MSADLETRLKELAPQPQREINVEQLKNEGARRRKRSRIVGSVAIAAALTVGAIVTTTFLRTEESAFVPPTQENQKPAFEGWDLEPGWHEMATPPEPRGEAVTVWTGTELFIWGGETSYGATLHADGWLWDPITDKWRPTAQAPIEGRYSIPSVWTGREVLVWGGRNEAHVDVVPQDPAGAAYDPTTDTWRTLPDAPIDPRSAVATVWTGSEMIVWGDSDGSAHALDGAAYDPDRDSWRRIGDAPIAMNQGQGIWTGDEMIVFGSSLDNRNVADVPRAQGMAYDPVNDTWRLLPETDLSPQATSVVWSGHEMIAWDYGLSVDAYSPSTDTWQKLPDAPMESSECYPSGAMAREVMLAFYCGQAASWYPEAETWRHADPPRMVVGRPVSAANGVLMAGASHETEYNGLWLYIPGPSSEPTYPSPWFYPFQDWFTYSTGVYYAFDGQPTAWSSTIPVVDVDNIYKRLEDLGPEDVLVVAALIGAEDAPHEPTEVFPEGGPTWELKIEDFEVRSTWEGQPRPEIPEYLHLQTLDGHFLELRVYFGRQDPSQEMLQEVEERIHLLRLP